MAIHGANGDLPKLDAGAHPVLTSGAWNFVPFVLITAAGLVMILRAFGIISIDRRSVSPELAPREDTGPPPAPIAYSESSAPKQTVSEAHPREVPPQRVFIPTDVTPQTLMGMFEGKTTVSARRLVQPYLGKWMKISGRFQNLGTLGSATYSVRLSTRFDHAYLFYFSKESWEHQLELLQIGQQVALVGKVTKIDEWSIVLEDCELVEGSAARGAIQISPPLPKRSPRRPGKGKRKPARTTTKTSSKKSS